MLFRLPAVLMAAALLAGFASAQPPQYDQHGQRMFDDLWDAPQGRTPDAVPYRVPRSETRTPAHAQWQNQWEIPQWQSESQVLPATYPRTLTGPLLHETDGLATARPPEHRPGFFQRVGFSTTWMPAAGDVELGFTHLELYGAFALPAPTTDSPLVITPTFGVHFLDAPASPGLPARLFDASMQFRWFHKLALAPWITADLAIEPGMHGDYEMSHSDTFRLPGHGLAIWQWSERVKLVFGVLYLDREDVNLLPAGGLIITPRDDVKLDLIFPQPKLAHRYRTDGWVEHWQYVAAEFGGGPYSIERAPGVQDVIILRDYRLMYGIERKAPIGGLTSRIEVGYVFGREVRFVSDMPTFNPDDTLLLRAGVSF